MDAATTVLSAPIAPGTRVEVRSRYRRGWCRGFEVAHFAGGMYRIRRTSDHSVVPVKFPVDQVRMTVTVRDGSRSE